MGADFRAYLETLHRHERESKSPEPRVFSRRQTMRQPDPLLTRPLTSLVSQNLSESQTSQQTPPQYNSDRNIGNEGADVDFSRSPLVAEVVAEPSVAHSSPLRDVATALIPVSLGDHGGTEDVLVITERLWDISSTEAEYVKVSHAP